MRSRRRTTRSRSSSATSAAGRNAARVAPRDDHLSFIAGIGRVHREELTAQGFPTLATAAAMPMPIVFKPSRGSRDTYTRIREQARVQHRTADDRAAGARAAAAGRGRAGSGAVARAVARRSVPRSGGRQVRPRRRPRVSVRAVGPCGADRCVRQYTPGPSPTPRSARRSRPTIDRIMDAGRDPGTHVYHFGHYEPSAFKRLMGRYATRRSSSTSSCAANASSISTRSCVRRFARESRATRSSSSSSSMASRERCHSPDVAVHLQAIELALEGNAPAVIPDEARAAVEAYNQDDCRSTEALRDWLERLRAELEAQGTAVPRPTPKAGEATRTSATGGAPAGRARAAARGRSRRKPPARITSSTRVAARVSARLAPPRGQGGVVGVLPAPRSAGGRSVRGAAGDCWPRVHVARVSAVCHVKNGKPKGSVVDRYALSRQEIEIGAR